MRFFLFVLITAWLLGIVIGVSVLGSRWLAVGILVVIGLIIWTKQSWSVGTAAVILICLGFVYGGSAEQKKLNECERGERLQGVVVGRPEKREKQVRFEAEIDNCLVLVSTSPWLEVRRGDKVEIKGGRWQNLDEVADFSAGYAAYLKRQGISATWFFPDVIVIKNNSGGWIRGKQVQKLHIGLQERVQTLFVEPDASLIAGMLLAQKGTIPKEITEQFRATGVSHILAISGLHVSIISGIIYVLVSWLPLQPRFRTGVMIMALWLYVGFIGAPVSAVRAGSFISIALVFFRLSKLVSLPTALILTVTVLATIKPMILFNVGFQLSISAVMGIFLALFLVGMIDLRLSKGGILIWLYRLALVSLGATLGTWPLATYHFSNVSLVGVAANLLVVPVVPFVLTWSIVAVAVSYIWLLGGLGAAWIVHGLIWWLNFITGKLAALPGVFIKEVDLPLWVVLVYYLVLVLLAMFILRWQRRAWREVWG